MARDVIHIMLHTLAIKLSDVTNIPSGHIWADHPSEEYINNDTYNLYPSIGITDLGFTPLANNYGATKKLPTNNPSIFTEYSPAGEIQQIFQIDVYSKEHYQMRNYRSLLNHFFQQTTLLATSGDILSDEFFSLKITDAHKFDEKPYILHYTIECHIQDYKEQNVYTVSQVGINLYQNTISSGNLANQITFTSGGI